VPHSFQSTVLIVPGLSNSGDSHWQTLWEKQYHFIRVEQHEWETPSRNDWVETLEKKIQQQKTDRILLVGHSLGCAAIAFWSPASNKKITGALLVAPSDTEAPSYPTGTAGFSPMPLTRLRFPSIVVTSDNDYYVSTPRAEFFAKAWGSEYVSIGNAGHINAAAGFEPWPRGLSLLKRLDDGLVSPQA